MLALADQFPEWKDFLRGLHVMLVGEDPDVIADVRHKLNACGYLVTCYMTGEDALQELLEDRGKSFHVVVVDATRSDTFDGFKIVAAAKHLTTIMMASTENMNITMQGIAAGASEFLQKPLSEERLKNIWQHVVRKALVTGHLAVPTTVEPLAHDVKSKVTPQFSLCSDDKEDGEFLNSVKQEKEAFCKYNGYEAVVVGEMPGATHEFIFQEADHDHESSYFDMDEKDNCEAFLCSTPPQLEQSCTRIVPTDHEDNQELVGSPSLSASQDQFNVACMKGDLNDIHECFDDCDHYLHIKSEVEEAVNNSAILNELFDSKAKMDSDKYLLMGDDQSMPSEFGDPKLCVDLQFNDIPDSLDDIGLGGDMLDDATDQSLSIGLDCLDDEDFQEADEEALLLAEVAKAEKGILLINPSNNSTSRNINNMHNSSSIDCIATVFPSYGSKSEGHVEETRCKSDSEQSCNNKRSKSPSGKKKMKVDWTPELHRRFVQAVEQLGVDKAIPSRILELMGVKCLTRHNIASHLQKYRSNRKHVLAREAEAASWNQRRQMEAAAAAATAAATQARTAPATHHQHRHPQQQQVAWPVARPLPQAQPCPALPRPPPALHVWGHPTLDHTMHFWPTWLPPGCQVDAWGKAFYPAQPILRVPLAPMPSIANMVVPPCGKLANLHPAKETVVAAINEVLRNPYIPLPLGLKPPSLESVVSELQRQGISMAPTAIV